MRTRELGMCTLLVVSACAHQRAEEAPGPRAQEAEQPYAQEQLNTPRQLARDGTREPVSQDDHGAPREGVPADNTARNERDRSGVSLTAQDQSESEPDRELLQRIRKAVIADDSLSFDAKNVKIITRDGLVTLRGAVANAREKASIEKVARDAAGTKRVTNQLEVAN